jgi:TolB protein
MKKIFLFILLLLCLSTSLFGEENIYLSFYSSNSKFNIGIDNFEFSDKSQESKNLAGLIQETIESDFILSRYFNVISQDQSNDKQQIADYWRNSGASVVLSASVMSFAAEFSVEIKITDVKSSEAIWYKRYKGSSADYRKMSHTISDEITKKLTGEKGIACSKIVFVNDNTKYKELYISDYDGYNLKRLTTDNKINILPKWAPDGKKIVYTSYLYNNPDLFEIDTIQKKRTIISNYQGLNAAGAFSPDSKYIALTLSVGNYPNLYLINTHGEVLRKMSGGIFIDTSPSFSPNGQEIVFISDRKGTPQLYIMDILGINVRSLGINGYCDSPAWSPRGDKIIFTMRRRAGEKFNLYIYDLPTTRLSRLTRNSGNNENPSWSPDGRFVVFSSDRSGKSEIYIMAIDGSGTRTLIDMPGASYTPSWSPILID